MDTKPKVYTYHTSVTWTEQKKGVGAVAGKPDIQVATPPEFKGHEGIWSPEDLFVASLNVCLMTTFLAMADRAGVGFTAYVGQAEGTLELVDGKFRFTKIVLRPRVTLKPGEDVAKAKQTLEKAEANCLISNSMACAVMLEPTIV